MHSPSTKAVVRSIRRRNRRASRRGVAIVEFAVVAPVFFLIIMGIIEVGRAVTVQQLLTNASREGARVAGNETTTSLTTVQNAVDNYLSGAGISGATTNVSPASITDVATGQPVTVTVSIPYTQVCLTPPWILGDRVLAATTVMTRQPSP